MILLASFALREQYVMEETISVLKKVFGDPIKNQTSFIFAIKFWVLASEETPTIFAEKITRESCAKCVKAAIQVKSSKKASERVVSLVLRPGLLY